MGIIRFAFVSLSCCCFVSCSELSPSCEASTAKQVVYQHVIEQLPHHVELRVGQITTLRTNYASGEVLCSAKLELHDTFANEKSIRAIGYKVHYDEQHQIRVTVL